MKIFAIDEAYDDKIIVLSCIGLEEDVADRLIREFIGFKQKLYGEGKEYLPFKWNLSKGNKTQYTALKILQKRNFTKKDTHPQVIEILSRYPFTIIAAICEDVRKFKFFERKSSVDFYPQAFKFVLTRIYFLLEKEGKIKKEKGIIIADVHPKEKVFKKDFSNIMLNTFYREQKFPNRIIPALKEYFLGSLSFSYVEFNCLLQISDCIAGCMYDWIKEILKRNQLPKNHLFEKLIPKLRKNPDYPYCVKGYGLKIFPSSGKLYDLIPSNLELEINKQEVNHGSFPF